MDLCAGSQSGQQQWVPGQLNLHSEILAQKTNNKSLKKKKYFIVFSGEKMTNMRNTLRTSRAMPISLLNLGGKQLKKMKTQKFF